MDFVDWHSMGVRAWVGGVQAADVCQEEQVACPHQAGYLHKLQLGIIASEKRDRSSRQQQVCAVHDMAVHAAEPQA